MDDLNTEIRETFDDNRTDLEAFSRDEALDDGENNVIIEVIEGGRSLGDDLRNEDLFNEHKAGVYDYGESILGKSAFGTLELTEDVQRNPMAQRTVGGADRKPDDDGGHLIGARFGGHSGIENLDAQNSRLNRGEYKAMENELAGHLKEDDKVFFNVDALHLNEGERPDAFMGYAIFEHPDGSRDSKSFSFINESKDIQDKWGIEPFGEKDETAALLDMEYSDGLK